MTVPAFPVPDIDAASAAFGATDKVFLKYADLPEDFRRQSHPMCDVAQKLFSRGGRLADHGLKIKAGLDEDKVYRALRAMLGSWAPAHEEKIGTVGVALANWCEPA